MKVSQNGRLTLIVFGAISLYLGSKATNGFTGGPILCPLRLLTGVNCPTCGITRAFGELAQGDLMGSLYLNPLGLALALSLIVWAINPDLLKKIVEQFQKAAFKLTRTTQRLSLFAAAALFWVWAAARNI